VAITYDAPSNTITVTGYTEGTPCTFLDIWNADQAGGWGVVSKQGGNQFLFDCRVVIGNGSTATWFADTKKQICFTDSSVSANYQVEMDVKNNAHLRFGTLLDDSTYRTTDGVSIIVDVSSYFYIYAVATRAGSEVNLYGCYLQGVYNQVHGITVGTNNKIYECTFNSMRIYTAVSPYSYNARRITIQRSAYGLMFYLSVAGTYEDVLVHSSGRSMYFVTIVTGGTLKDFKLKNPVHQNIQCYDVRVPIYLVNPTLDTWSFNWVGAQDGKIYRQYTFNLKVTEQDGTAISGATVTLKDKNDATVFSVSTAVDGTITEQTVSRGYYDQAHGDTLQDYSPHTLTIEKSGYQTYEKTFTLEQKTDWEIKLAKAVGVFLSFGSPVINLKKTDPENKNVMVVG